MTSTLNQQTDNSVMSGTADSKIPADGTGSISVFPMHTVR